MAFHFENPTTRTEYPSEYPSGYRPQYQRFQSMTQYRMVNLECKRCSTHFSFTPLTYAQAKNPYNSRPYCHSCFQEMQRRKHQAERIAIEQRKAVLLTKRIADETAARVFREAAEAEAKRKEDEQIEQLRLAFNANPDEFFRNFARLTTKADKLSAENTTVAAENGKLQTENRKLSEKNDALQEENLGLSYRISQIEQVLHR